MPIPGFPCSAAFGEFDRIMHEMDRLYHEAALRCGLSDTALLVLYGLCQLGEGCLQKDVADRFYLPKQTVNAAVRKLEQEGAVELRPAGGRQLGLYLTEPGHRLVERTVLPLARTEAAAMNALTEAEQQALLQGLDRYVTLLRQAAQSL